jgi:hypothetical protein
MKYEVGRKKFARFLFPTSYLLLHKTINTQIILFKLGSLGNVPYQTAFGNR